MAKENLIRQKKKGIKNSHVTLLFFSLHVKDKKIMMLIAFVLTTYLSTFALCGEIKKYIWLPYKLMNIFVRYKRYIKKEIFYCQNCTFFRF